MTARAYDRRAFLRRAGLAGAGATALALGVPRPPAHADDSLAPFVHGVASGDPASDRVIIWTRITLDRPGAVPVVWRVATDVSMRHVVTRGTVHTGKARDHTVKVDVADLRPDTWYYYDFAAPDGRRSLVGRTKTAPAGPVDHLRFGVVSCSNYNAGYFNGYANLAARNDLETIIHTGDYIYEFGNGGDFYGPPSGEPIEGRLHSPDHEIVTLADYRKRHASYKLDPDLRRLHQLYPFVTTWDDHESADNSWRGGATNHGNDDYGPEGDWEERKEASRRAYDEWMPIRTDDHARIWRSFRYGDLLDMIVMDTRLERDEQVGLTGPRDVPLGTAPFGAEIDDPDRIMVSKAQRDFVLGELSRSQADDVQWRVLAQQVVMAQWDAGGVPRYPFDPPPDLPVFLRDGGNALNPDAWDGYTAERNRLFSHVRSQSIDNLVVLTGDVHTSWANDLTEDPHNPAHYDPTTGQGALGVEFVCPSLTSKNFDEFGEPFVSGAQQGTMLHNPHIKWIDVDDHGYFVLDVSRDAVQADWYFLENLLEPDTTEALAASWRVDDGAGHLTEAEGPAPAGREAARAPGGEPRSDPGGGGGRERVTTTTASSGLGGGADVEGEVLPATGGPLSLAGGMAVLGAAGLARILRRRGDLAPPT